MKTKKQCSRCNKDKDIIKFGKDKYSSDSLTHSCKACRNNASKMARKKINHEKINKIIISNKLCPQCNITKLVSEFSKDKYTKTGITTHCKKCRRENGKKIESKNIKKYSNMECDKIRSDTKEKKCSSCGLKKEGLSFPIDKTRADGLATYCLICIRKRYTDYDNRNREFRKERGRERMKKKKFDPSYRFSEYRRGAISRDIEFSLTIDDLLKYWKKCCTYCGDPIDSIGLDRINNKKGYIPNNITSCCFSCNQMKSTRDFEKWINQIKKIAKYNK